MMSEFEYLSVVCGGLFVQKFEKRKNLKRTNDVITFQLRKIAIYSQFVSFTPASYFIGETVGYTNYDDLFCNKSHLECRIGSPLFASQ
jgi:hypothetical protein